MMQKALPIVFLYSYPEDTRFSVMKHIKAGTGGS
ncbi:uncharacterized protein METZ01_LOCUS165031 [marine metagenome]|uniref:Uncharacterized protein n=1 Tax=marine metagenome TaxID=408172 RepID=A0A382BG69_9ZZZZ